MVASIFNNKFVKLHSMSEIAEDITAAAHGATLMYEIDPSLTPSLPDQPRPYDNMYNLPE